MKIKEIIIHNFRSIKEQTLLLNDYSLLVGANNSGKSNIIDALRIFYEKEKYDRDDSPKFSTTDEESWIEIEFRLEPEEFEGLKEEYKQRNNSLRVRKFLRSSKWVKANQSNIYGYVGDVLKEDLFYGAKNVSEAKLGDIIYIPEVAKVDDYTKLSGPSAFRDSLNYVVKKVVKNSQSFESLDKSFSDFNETFQTEATKDGYSIQSFKDDVNYEISDWDVSFDISINKIKPEEIIKNLVSFYIKDRNLGDMAQDISSFGQGLQRHIIYSLLKVSAKYKDTATVKSKKEFSPELSLILFEEPEAFLHPAQQEVLNDSLKEIASENNQQVLISTHSTHFTSRNISDIASMLKLKKVGAETLVFKIDDEALNNICIDNKELKRILGEDIEEGDLELESIRYCLWLDPDRCCAFFADAVLICEGMSEKALIEQLIYEKRINLKNRKAYIFNAGGKYDIHRYMNIFGGLGISHSILYDSDNNNEKHRAINEFIQQNRNEYTLECHSFDEGELEDFLGVEKVGDRYKKPLNIIWNYKNGKITEERIQKFIGIIEGLLAHKVERD